MTQYAELPKLLQASSSAIGGMIGLGRKFVESGIREMDGELLPLLERTSFHECSHPTPFSCGSPWRYISQWKMLFHFYNEFITTFSS